MMRIFDWLWGGRGAAATPAPRAAVQELGGGTLVNTSAELEAVMRGGNVASAGVAVTAEAAMRVAAVFGCVRLIAGASANMPIDIMRRVDAKVREELNNHPLAMLFKTRPNRWQTPAEFKRLMTAWVLLKGAGYALIVRSARGYVTELVPLEPDRMKVTQAADLGLVFEYTRRDGGRVVLPQSDVFFLKVLTLDGVHGASVLTYAREAVGAAIVMERHGATTFKNAARPSNVLRHPNSLGAEGLEFLRASLEEYRSGGENEGKTLILEEGMEVANLAMTAEDAQWIEARKFTRTDIAMFFGVPPHMIGDTEKSTSWGTGIEQQSIGFVTYTLEDYFTAWEQTIKRDCVGPADANIYARFNRVALVRGDLKARTAHYTSMLQWGVYSPDEVRSAEDMNPRPDGEGGRYYEPPNTAGDPTGAGADTSPEDNPTPGDQQP